MTTPSIGSLSFLIMEGTISPPGIELEHVTRAGVDGTAFRDIGIRSDVCTVRTTVDINTGSVSAQTEVLSYHAMIGTNQTVIDGNGNTWTSLYVINVKTDPIQPIYRSIGGLSSGANALVTATWTLQHGGATISA